MPDRRMAIRIEHYFYYVVRISRGEMTSAGDTNNQIDNRVNIVEVGELTL